MRKQALVSVIIPTYKRSDSLSRAIDSVLNQSYQSIEVVVVDDNNPETEFRRLTEERMKAYIGDTRVRYIKHPYNKNGSAARNTGFCESKGEYVMFLDDDDEFLPNKVEMQVDCLSNTDNAIGMCYTYFKRYKNGKLHTVCAQELPKDPLKEALSRDLWTQPGSNLMIKRSAVEAVGGWDESFKRNQDEEFQIKLLMNYRMVCVPEWGLKVNLETTYRYFDFEAINAHFVDCFKSIIDTYSKEDQQYIYGKLNLQVFRDLLLDKKKPIKALKMILGRKVSLKNVIGYTLYFIDRKINKVDKPYRLR